jgi:23S rRNA G2445 N2-methylase RlmL
MRWIATCPHETVGVLAAELSALGIERQQALHRGVAFDTDLATAYRAHICLRTASRLQRVVAEFDAPDLATLRSELKNIAWPAWIRSHRPFTVAPALTDPQSQAIGEQAVIEAVVESIQQGAFEKSAPLFKPAADNPIAVVAFLRAGRCVLGLDSAGRALHKRGWRMTGHPAVLKETLAASILLLAGYTGREPLLDPMCGSGTIAIEAAYIALNKAPLIHRGKDDFALEHLAGFDRPLWRSVSDQLRAAKSNVLPAPIFVSDIRGDYVDLARVSARRARVEKYLDFSVKPFREWEPPASTGLLIANLPYGERIGAGAINALYRDVGAVLKERFSKWRIALLVPSDAPSHLLSLKAQKELALANGALSVKLLIATPSRDEPYVPEPAVAGLTAFQPTTTIV